MSARPRPHLLAALALLRAAALALLGIASLAPAAALAAAPDVPPAVIETPHRDPWVAPAQGGVERRSAPSSGADFAAEAQRRLAASFTAADSDGDGMLTRDEAARGFGFIARHFDAIDAGGSGRVGFDDLLRFLDQRARAAAATRR